MELAGREGALRSYVVGGNVGQREGVFEGAIAETTGLLSEDLLGFDEVEEILAIPGVEGSVNGKGGSGYDRGDDGCFEKSEDPSDFRQGRHFEEGPSRIGRVTGV